MFLLLAKAEAEYAAIIINLIYQQTINLQIQ